MPVGIDTNTFFRDKAIERKGHSVLFLGRISPIKHLDVLIGALSILDKEGIVFTVGIYGNPADKDKEYYKKIRAQAVDMEKKKKIIFYGGIPNTQTPSKYNQHELFVNATPSGSFDKTILEAMACECIVVASNGALKDIISERFLFKEGNVADLAEKLRDAMFLQNNEKIDYQVNSRHHATQHDLSFLAEQLFVSLRNLSKELPSM